MDLLLFFELFGSSVDLILPLLLEHFKALVGLVEALPLGGFYIEEVRVLYFAQSRVELAGELRVPVEFLLVHVPVVGPVRLAALDASQPKNRSLNFVKSFLRRPNLQNIVLVEVFLQLLLEVRRLGRRALADAVRCRSHSLILPTLGFRRFFSAVFYRRRKGTWFVVGSGGFESGGDWI